MSRKRNPYIPLFTHDIMSSMKCRRLSMRATGLYLWLLCLMNEKPQQGRWALSTNEDHPTWKNSLTYRALQNADKYGRLPMFATLMARKFLPWKSGEVLKALQELYRFKLIVVEDDAIIQPRMYRDNGFKLREDTMREYLTDDASDPYDDPETEVTETYEKTVTADGKKDGNKGTNNGTNKVPQKVHGIHAHAPRAEFESENNINNSNIGGVGDDASQNSEQAKTQDRPKQTRKKETQTPPATVPVGSPDGKKRRPVADNPPTIEEIQAYFAERAAQGKPFVYVTPDTFFDACEQSGWRLKDGKPMMDWRARVRTFENYRREHGDPTRPKASQQGEPVRQTAGKDYNDW